MRLGGQRYGDAIARLHRSTGNDDSHNPGLADQIPRVIATEHGRHQAGLNAVQLLAGITQTGDLHDRFRADPEAGRRRQPEEIDSPDGDILPHLPGNDIEPSRPKLIMQLGVDQVNLAQIRLTRVARHPGAVLNGLSSVRVPLDPVPRDQHDRLEVLLAHRVGSAAADCDNPSDRRQFHL